MASPTKPIDPTAILTDAELAEIDTVSVHQYQVLLKENKKLGNQLKSLEGELEIAKSQILVFQFCLSIWI